MTAMIVLLISKLNVETSDFMVLENKCNYTYIYAPNKRNGIPILMLAPQ